MSATADTPVTELPEKVIKLTGIADAALTKAAERIAAYEQQQEKIASAIPAVVDALVSGERIEDTEAQRTKIAEILQDPVQTLELLCKVAVHRNGSEQSLGSPVDPGQTKTAGNGQPSYDSINDPRPGLRTSQVKQSSVTLFSRLGLPTPTSE
jgi:hypothetical protein